VEAAAEVGMIDMIGGWLEYIIRAAPAASRTLVAVEILLWASAAISGVLVSCGGHMQWLSFAQFCIFFCMFCILCGCNRLRYCTLVAVEILLWASAAISGVLVS
jgi:hypothetical protein